MKKALFIALIAASSLAQASRTAQDQATYERDCGIVGEVGRTAYLMQKKDGKFDMPNEYKAKELAHKPLIEWAVMYGTTKALDETDAYRMSYAKCEDNLARVYKNLKSGKTTTLADLD